jgi:adenylosuccinate lyase
LANLEASHGLVFSQPVLLALVANGSSRDDAYRIVQRNAMKAWDEGLDFRALLEADSEVDDASLGDAFDLERSLRHLDRLMANLDAIDLDGDQSARPMSAAFNTLAGTPTSRHDE